MTSDDNRLEGEFENKLKQYELKVERLIEENNKLYKEIQKEKRLRYAARNLIIGVDKAIVAQIERLHKQSLYRPPVISKDDFDYDNSTAKNLLAAIQTADLKTYYSQEAPLKPPKFITYKVVKKTYFIPRHVAAVTVKKLLGLRKKT
jgi:hypothetical protein